MLLCLSCNLFVLPKVVPTDMKQHLVKRCYHAKAQIFQNVNQVNVIYVTLMVHDLVGIVASIAVFPN